MQLLFKQRPFSWIDTYDIYDGDGNTLYTVRGQLSWGHCLKIFDTYGNEIATVKQKLFTWMPRFELYLGGYCIGSVYREFSFFKPRYHIDCNGWQVEGDFFEWDYSVSDIDGRPVARVSKQLFRLGDTYVIDVYRSDDALCALMLVLAIDAEKCSRD